MADWLRIGAGFDWISPLLGWAGDIANGGGHTFLIPLSCGWSGREVARLLRNRGIHCWGLMVINETITVTVRRHDAERVRKLLESAGVL